ncbi:DUF222 domain-containing protein [Ancrocorticia populi]|uniref:HNH endonuclease signature motif containing protein n=2 Tax=Ancrocorticia populi TaxID=2175228 RepID=UPI003F9C1DE4
MDTLFDQSLARPRRVAEGPPDRGKSPPGEPKWPPGKGQRVPAAGQRRSGESTQPQNAGQGTSRVGEHASEREHPHTAFGVLADALRGVTGLCQAVSVGQGGLTETVELVTAVKEAIRHLDGVKLAGIARIDEIQNRQAEESPSGRRPALPGEEATLAASLMRAGKQSKAQAGREMKQARALSTYPLFAKAIEKGVLSDAYLDVLTSHIGEGLVPAAQRDEQNLLELALAEPVEYFKKKVRSWRAGQSPATAEKEAALQAAQETFSVFPDRDGYRLSGWLTNANGIALASALREIVGVPAQDDYRRPQQRNAEALVTLASSRVPRVGGGTPSGAAAGSAPPRHEILVHVPLSTLVQTEKAIEAGCATLSGPDGSGPASEQARTDCATRGAGLGRAGECLASRVEQEADLGEVLAVIRAGIEPGMLDGFTPASLPDGSSLAPSQLAEMMCDSHLTRAVFTAAGEPLDVSRRQRLFSPRQAKAVIARDRHCQFPGCTRGPEYGEVHHAQQWERGGSTIVDNAVLLCFAHHRVIHSEHITITHHTGGFSFTRKDGKHIGTSRARPLLA